MAGDFGLQTIAKKGHTLIAGQLCQFPAANSQAGNSGPAVQRQSHPGKSLPVGLCPSASRVNTVAASSVAVASAASSPERRRWV